MYQVPKNRVDVEALLSDGSRNHGAVFMAESSLSVTPRLEDFLNQREERFFPFSHEDGNYSLLNKNQLIYLRSSEKDIQFMREQLMLEPREVTICLVDGEEISGQVFSMLPKQAPRVSDFFNQPEMFLPLYVEEDKVIINSQMILWVKD